MEEKQRDRKQNKQRVQNYKKLFQPAHPIDIPRIEPHNNMKNVG